MIEDEEYFKKNRIVSAANYHEGFPLILGPRHWDGTMHKQYDMMLKAYGDSCPPPHAFTEGFIDKFGNFKTRQEAWVIANEANQVIRRCGGDTSKGGTLYSENLY